MFGYKLPYQLLETVNVVSGVVVIGGVVVVLTFASSKSSRSLGRRLR